MNRNSHDLVFHYSTFNHKQDPDAIELLFTAWLDPAIKNKNLNRSGSCYLFKKATSFHKSIKFIHPKDSTLIDNLSFEEILDIFNHTEYFYCYNPYSFYDVIAALCGCVSIVYPLKGVKKFDWLKTRASFQMNLKEQNNISGIAYGIDDLTYAKNTISKVDKEQNNSIELGKKTVKSFAEKSIDYFFLNNKLPNTVELMIKKCNWGNCKNKDLEKLVKNKDKKINLLKSNIKSLEKMHNEELKHLHYIIQSKEAKIAFMQSSKSWKLREFIKRYI